MKLKNLEFYSAPCSPKLCKSPQGYSHPNSTIDEFEFETSSRFNLDDIDFDLEERTEKKNNNKERTQSEDEFVPAMAFKSPLGHSRRNSTIDEFEFETSSRFNLDDIDFDIEDRTEKKKSNKQRTQNEDEFVPAMAFKSPLGHSHRNSTIDEFEFETSSRFNLEDIDFDLEDQTEKKNNNRQRTQSVDEFVPAMAFADELFSDGKVLPLPPRLKIPPPPERRHETRSGKSSAVSSPRSPASALKIKFVHQNLWNDDFDPFLVALQSVKKDGTGKTRASNHGPRPNTNSTEQVMGLQLDQQQPNSRNGPRESPRLLIEPKGLAFARAVVNMENETGRFDRFTVSGSILKSKQNCRDGKRFSSWKRNKLRKILSLLGKIGLKSARSAG